MFQINDKVKFIPEMVADRCHFTLCLGYVGRIIEADDRGVVMVRFKHSGYPWPVTFAVSADRLMLVESATQSA